MAETAPAVSKTIEVLGLIDDENLARLAGEVLTEVSKRGISAWEELASFIDTMPEDERDELQASLVAHLIGEIEDEDE